MKKLSILVIDDNIHHAAAAIVQLAGHDVTVVTSFAEGRLALTDNVGNEWPDDGGLGKDLWISSGLREKEEKLESDIIKKGKRLFPSHKTWDFGSDFWPKPIKDEYDRLYRSELAPIADSNKKIVEEKIAYLLGRQYDVVLCDLLMPASAECLGKPEKYFGQEMPLGTLLVLRALQIGVKMVALVTDSNHHDHPATAALDMFTGPFQMGGVRVEIMSDAILRSEDRETTPVKNWAGALERLLFADKSE